MIEPECWAAALLIETGAQSRRAAEDLWSGWSPPRRRTFERRVEAACARGARPVLAEHPLFPSAWRHLSRPPSGAWLLGSWVDAEARIAVVGARAAPPRVCGRVREQMSPLVQSGLRIVSGAAVGVDTAAHVGARHAGSIAVIPFGIEADCVGQGQIPVETMLEGGGAIWCAALLRHGARARFVARNRLLVALCERVLVAWAARRSGSMHTVRFAQALGRPVEAWWTEGDPPDNDGCKALCRPPEPPERWSNLLRQLKAVDGQVNRLQDSVPERLHAELFELECEGLIRRMGCGRYQVLMEP